MEAFDIISKEANALAKKEPNRASKNWYSIKTNIAIRKSASCVATVLTLLLCFSCFVLYICV
jgi:hypothetical protein